MKKSTLFISAALITFMLAVMFGVVTAYQKIVQSQTEPVQPLVQDGKISAEEATKIASEGIGRNDVYWSEQVSYSGTEMDAYLVTFSSGDLVYVGFDGSVKKISKLPINGNSEPMVVVVLVDRNVFLPVYPSRNASATVNGTTLAFDENLNYKFTLSSGQETVIITSGGTMLVPNVGPLAAGNCYHWSIQQIELCSSETGFLFLQNP
jgi:hypothetical protein